MEQEFSEQNENDEKGLEWSGRTVEEAVDEALKKLDITRDHAEVTILDPGNKGFLGIGSKPARVLVQRAAQFDPEKLAKHFLSEVTDAMGIACEFETKMRERQLFIDMKGRELGALIGKRGQTLDSLQYLTNLVVNKGKDPYVSVVLDTENYRQRRRETLESLARSLAKKAKQTRKNVVLEPMNPHERRIIHAALQNDRYVTTYSEGDEPYRYVVITNK